MEVLIELLFQIFGEFFLGLLVQIFGDLGANVIAAYRKRGTRRPFVSAFGHVFFGALFGGLSLLVFHHSFAHAEWMRWVALLGSPVVAGSVSMAIGTRRRDAGKDWVAFETFSYGFAFAFSFALVRFLATMPSAPLPAG